MRHYNPPGDPTCDVCGGDYPITQIKTPGWFLEICLMCTLDRFPGRGPEWFEDNHRPFSDHVSDRIAAAQKREDERHLATLLGQPGPRG